MKIKDIASALNVSAATVSLALNNKDGISVKTQKKIIGFANTIGYAPHTNSKNIRFVIYKSPAKIINNLSFFSQIIEGIESESHRNGYNLIVSYIYEGKENNKVMNIINHNLADGLIILATEMVKDDFKIFENTGMPTVILDNYFVGVDIDTVIINNVQGAYDAVSFLLDLGHKDIGYLHGSTNINNFIERKKGLLEALSDRGLTLRSDSIFNLDSTINGAYKDMCLAILSNQKLPSAFFADNDVIAFGAIKALQECGIRIPEDISIVGFDNIPFCEALNPGLTSVSVYKRSMGIIAVQRLLEKIGTGTPGCLKIEVGTKLIKRNSVKNNL